MAENEKSEAVRREEEILAFWKENDIFQKTLEKEAKSGDFIFYEGPPTANGRPGVHHMESRSFKDAVPRYKTMRGYHVPRRAGWDTHGLPVELEVEKKLGFSGKPDIEKYGIAAFNKKCRESVFEYISEWSKFTDRIGYWVDQSKAYFTFDAPYMETLWSIFKKVGDDGRLYKDYRVVPWCSRCGTALSTHELAQGYADVKDLSVTVKFELEDEPGTYLLAWTTTPWTLPGNIGLAVGEKVAYGKYENQGENVILSTKRAETVLPEGWNYVGPVSANELVGKRYKALYPFAEQLASETEKGKFENAFKVYLADFVTDEDGTGVVHTAVMYGQEDFELGTKVGLPKVHLVAPDGKFIAGTGFLEGRFVKEADENGKPTLAVDIIDDLKKRGLFFSQENHLHSYPFCWRCKTPLIYYARDSWYVRMSDLRPKLVAENQKINWEPAHIRDGRMGEWLAGDKDWAISRERYWGTPLPIWENADGTERVMIGSVEELKARTKKSGNTYFVMRHAEAEHNLKSLAAKDDAVFPSHLTENGHEQALEGARTLQEEGITRIYVSPLIRTCETAKIVAETLGLSDDAIVVDERLREFDFGDLNDGPIGSFVEYRNAHSYVDPLPGGESYQQVKNRIGEFLYEIEEKHQNERILIVTHGAGFESLQTVAEGLNAQDSKEMVGRLLPKYATPTRLDFVPLPHNEQYELDLHRPYIDDVILISDSGTELCRVKEVADVWFDSGAMPFAEDHYPFENKEWIDTVGYPADFISEAIDQTRGWFYTLLAVGVLMDREAPYKNVICLGHILDDQGLKMSKSKGNIVNPWDAMERFGADTIRYWMYSVNQPGDSKNFDEKTVNEVANKVFNPLVNALAFYESYRELSETKVVDESTHVIDRWIRARLQQTALRMTTALDAYDLFTATRELREYIGDLSQWYVRRSRDRMRSGPDAALALATLRAVLADTAKLLAPFAPFTAEYVYRAVRHSSDPESVHLCDWPMHQNGIDDELLTGMAEVRERASEALKLRQKAGIVARQPLARMSIPGALTSELVAVLAEEVNVKEVLTEQEAVDLDTDLTPELIREGDVRVFLRSLADARKSMNLEPKDMVAVHVSDVAQDVLRDHVAMTTSQIAFVAPESIPDAPYTAELSFGSVPFTVTRVVS